ncbi:hypothetical protein B0A55_10630 [Friedmanniomyces simplex]|uniref:Cercosporin MFS transporter CTB4 n=1 Tax=Friedmanniomyces simplex TaxID=329884 RepID=A0A4U0WN87_9PEZI|nr:hypothetical protein B0A55_10630 [Friedmanniomyces simplex]
MSSAEEDVEKAAKAAPAPNAHDDNVDDEQETDDEEMVNLPYRTLTYEERMGEYLSETPTGLHAVETNKTGISERWELVTFTKGDNGNPKNWSKPYKWWCTMTVAITCFAVAFNSSVITADIVGVSREFNVNDEVSLLAITLFVIGFGIGPMAWAPLSEILGRKPIYASTLLVAVIFIIPCAVSKNMSTLLVCRAIDGIAFSAPMTLVGGTLVDLWRNEERGVPMACFSAAPFIGPAIGPLVGGFLADALGWRWLYWIQLILSAVCYILITFTVPETYAPTILARRAKKRRKETGDAKYVTEQDLFERPLGERLGECFLRPFQLLFLEPIVLLLSLYMSVLYGLLYMFFVAFPIIYQEGKGYSASITGLMFIPVAIDVLLSAACAPFVNSHYLSLVKKHGGFPVAFGFIFLYNSANNYLVDSYQHQAASALAAKTFLRSFWGASVILFTTQMYHKVGYQWAGSILAFIALACCAIPFVFFFKGAQIRKRSKFAYKGEGTKRERRAQ